MQVSLDTHTMRLEDMPLDEGYASEKIRAKDILGEEVEFGGQNGKTQIIISAPFLDKNNFNEFNTIFEDKDLEMQDVEKFFIVSSKEDVKIASTMPLIVDENEMFGDEFGVRISDAPFKGKLTKSLFIISKDGAIFYEEVPTDLNTSFEVEKIYQKTMAALACYTGKGCH